MAKTRIKTTPTRLQKDALMSASMTAGVGEVKLKRLRQPAPPPPLPPLMTSAATTKHSQPPKSTGTALTKSKPISTSISISKPSSTIIVTAPKRTNSISSATSSISHASDTHSMYSDCESSPSSPPVAPQEASATTKAILTTSYRNTNGIDSMKTTTISTANNSAIINNKTSTNVTTTTITTKTLNGSLCKTNKTQKPETSSLSTSALSAPSLSTSVLRSNGNNCKPTISSLPPSLSSLKNRKVYMITEKCDSPEFNGSETKSNHNGALHAANGQKRKMYLIMEENTADSSHIDGAITDADDSADGSSNATHRKFLKTENGIVVASKKLTLFADKSSGDVLTGKFEKILPEILNRIQAKDVADSKHREKLQQQQQQIQINGVNSPHLTEKINCMEASNHEQQQEPEQHPKQQRQPITLPPKKNRSKIITTTMTAPTTTAAPTTAAPIATTTSTNAQITNSTTNNVTTNNSNYNNNNGNNIIKLRNGSNGSTGYAQIKQISAATPVIVSAASLLTNNDSNHNSNGHTNSNNIMAINVNKQFNGQKPIVITSTTKLMAPQKNINLSSDFLFLMKMLPKLESIPEPHRNHVKNCIEKIITQNSNMSDGNNINK